mgnify:CR=1 FL=1
MTIPGSLNKVFFVVSGAIAMAGGANAAPGENAIQITLPSEEITECLRENGVEIIADEGNSVNLRMTEASEPLSRQEDESGAMDAGETLLPTVSGEAIASVQSVPVNWLACLSGSASRE